LGLESDQAFAEIADRIGFEAHYGDLTDPTSLGPAVEGVDAICHLAAALTTHDVEDQLYIDVNLNGTYNLLAAARAHAPDVKRFVYVSSDAVYWPALTGRPLYLPVDEAHPLMAGSVYGATKVGAEAMCRAFWRTYDVPYTIVRPTATASPAELVDPTSPFGRRWFLSAAIARLERNLADDVDRDLLKRLSVIPDKENKLLLLTDSTGESSLTMLTDARDVAAAMHLMVDSAEAQGETFNVGPDAPHSERQLVERLGSALGLDVVEVKHVGVRPSWYVSSAKARGVLGYKPQWTVFDMVDEAVIGQAS
jgi:nucleoside-diphosphate-sugar epimerase